VQLRANAVCAELAKTTAERMAANRILFMGNSLADKFPSTMSAFGAPSVFPEAVKAIRRQLGGFGSDPNVRFGS
jgi:hypothetical protein